MRDSSNEAGRDESAARRTVAVVGATDAVGRELRALLEQRDFPCEAVRLVASERSAGTTLEFRGDRLTVRARGSRQSPPRCAAPS